MSVRSVSTSFRIQFRGVLLVLTAAAAMPASAQQQEPFQLNPIIVQGERKERSLRETRSSVTVFQTEDLDRRTGQDLNEIVNGTPNVNVRSQSEIPNIRGIEGGGPGGIANTALSGTLPRVALIIDDVARPAAVPNSDASSLWDVEQVEVLRGPQTTLRGRATIGGAIVVKTFDPSFEPEVAAQSIVEIDEFHGPTQIYNAMVSGGLIPDRLAMRGTFEHQTGDDPREIVNAPDGRDDDILTEFHQTRARLKLLITPQGEAGPWRILGTGEFQKGQTPQTRATVQNQGFTVGGPRDFDDREVDYTTGGLRLFDTEAGTGALDVSYAFSEDARLRSISSYSVTDFKSREEQPQSFFFDFEEGVANQDFLLEFGQDNSFMSGLVGATYTRRSQDVHIDNVVPPVLPSGVAVLTADGVTDTASVFTDLRLGLTDRVDLLLGGRVLWNRDQRDTFSSLTSVPPFNTPVSDTKFDESEIVLLPSLGVAYEVTETQTVLASARRGWNAGGASVNFFTGEPFEFDSETVWTLETGYRFESLDGRYSLAATGFYNFYDDPQFFLETVPGDRFSIEVVNLPKGETYGLELEGRAALTRELTAQVGIGLLETKITESTDANEDLEGNRFGKDPGATVTAGIVWRPDFVPGLSLDGRVTYIGESFNDFNNESNEKIGDYTLVDVGLSYFYGPVEGRLFLNNIFDKTGLTTRVGDFAAVTPPRTFGAALTVRF